MVNVIGIWIFKVCEYCINYNPIFDNCNPLSLLFHRCPFHVR